MEGGFVGSCVFASCGPHQQPLIFEGFKATVGSGTGCTPLPQRFDEGIGGEFLSISEELHDGDAVGTQLIPSFGDVGGGFVEAALVVSFQPKGFGSGGMGDDEESGGCGFVGVLDLLTCGEVELGGCVSL